MVAGRRFGLGGIIVGSVVTGCALPAYETDPVADQYCWETTGTLDCSGCPRPLCAPSGSTGADPVIDDLNDGDMSIRLVDGRVGVWYTYNDKTGGIQIPAAYDTTTCGGTFFPTDGKACMSASGFALWGAGMGFDLNNACSYDASRFSGVKFTLSGEMRSGSLRFMVGMPAMQEMAYRGTCNPAIDVCGDQYGVDILTIPAQPTIEVLFTSLRQGGWGLSVPFDPRQLINVHWELKPGGQPLDVPSVCVDDVQFY